jgi:hypothetical protein
MGNRYYPVNGKELASVTTITGLADKSDALIPWAVNCAVDYINDRVEAEIMRGAEHMVEIPDSALELARTEWRTVRDEAGDIGTQVHDALEAWLNAVEERGIPNDGVKYFAPEDAKATVLFYAAAEKIMELAPFTVLATEQKVVNEDEWYAGRFDALLEVDGETWLIDFKTGASFYPEWGMQLAAYAEAWVWNEYYRRVGRWIGNKQELAPDKPTIDRIKVLRLDKKTLKAYWKEYGGPKDGVTRAWYYRAFLGLRDAFYVLKAKKAAKLAFMEGDNG